MKNLSNVSAKNKIYSVILLITLISTGLVAFKDKNKIRKSKELDQFIKLYNYVPFNIPRDGDGIGTVISFKKKKETVIAAPNECFKLEKLTIDTIRVNLPDYDYILSKQNDLEFNTGRVFGNNVKLTGALKNERVDSVKVSFSDVFVVRATRISVERHMKDMDELCRKRALQKKNYLIERVLGVGSIKVSFYNKNGQEIKLDADLMDGIKLGNTFQRQFQGKSSLSFSEPRLIGYRIWDVDIELGLAETNYVMDSVSIDETLNLKLK